MTIHNELESWISLTRVPGVGPKTFQALLSEFDSPLDALNASISSLKNAGVSDKIARLIVDSKNNQSQSILADTEWLNAADNHHIITLNCKEYPPLLKQISNPPPLLYIHGNPSLLKDPQLAIVGSRQPTQGGQSASYDFAHHLGKTGLCITSGLALGVDGYAHQGAIDSNSPTIAVIATGIDRVYPAKHRDLAHKIVEKGAIVSEFPIGTQPKAENFPRRNRIISGLSHGTLVVEAALQSGSLITARLAGEQNREVFAIPGSIHNPLARGCHQLIRQGAKLVETAQDILEEMANVIDMTVVNKQEIITISKQEHASDSMQKDPKLQGDYQTLLDKMGFDPTPIDQLVVRTGFSPESIAAMLLILELQNQVTSSGGGTYTRLK